MKSIILLLVSILVMSCTAKRDDSPSDVAQAFREVRYLISVNTESDKIEFEPQSAGNSVSRLNDADVYTIFYNGDSLRCTVAIENMLSDFRQITDSTQVSGKKFQSTLLVLKPFIDEDGETDFDDDEWYLQGPIEISISSTVRGTSFLSEDSRIVKSTITGVLKNKEGKTVPITSGELIFPVDKKNFGFEPASKESEQSEN